MNKTDIIETALHVWGRDLYKTTSLSRLAQALGVTKPALYRHFAGKKDLLEGVYGYCCDHYVSFVAKTFDKTVEDRDSSQGILLIARTVAEYCVRHKYIFIFFLFRVYGDTARDGDMLNHFVLQGMDLTKHWFFLRSRQGYPNPFQLIIPTVYFLAALFHKSRAGSDPSEEEIQRFLSLMEDILSRGLGFDRALVEALDFGRLEETGSCRLPPEGEDEGLLKAVAGVVAQTGPWNASMGMVAKRSGLSKSGLYAHFKNKADMLSRMFVAEFDRILGYAEQGKSRSDKPEEQLYLAIVAIAKYLRSRPEILIAMDWIRTRRLELEISAPSRARRLFAGIEMKAASLAGSDMTGEALSQWVFFLIVHTLMRRPGGSSFAEVPDSSFRMLYKFIALGIEGVGIDGQNAV